MGATGIVIILILIGGSYYLYANPDLLKSSIQNPLDQFLVKNNTPSSTISETESVIGFGKPFSYYSCSSIGDVACQQSFGIGTLCNFTNGECYTIKR